jgi:SIR2-like domain
MLDDSDVGTFHALRALSELHGNQTKPLILWLGAGVSCWRGFPTWKNLAESVHKEFSRFVTAYDRSIANSNLDCQNYPELFQLCREADERRYFSLLADLLHPRKSTPVYARFIDSLQPIKPISIITTNVDESLENSLDDIIVLQRSDLARTIDLIQKKQSFVVKAHGTYSQLESAIFTMNDYDALLRQSVYLELIKYIFTQSVVLFLGYSLAEKYVLDLLYGSEDLKGIFASSPHYAVVSDVSKPLPSFITPITYIPDPHKDHRSAIQVIEEIALARDSELIGVGRIDVRTAPITSAHFVPDILPDGSYETGVKYTCSDGSTLVHGFGLTDEELPNNSKSSMHDLIVGLLCFDHVYTHLPSVGNLAKVISEASFETLLRSDCLRFIDWPYQHVVQFLAGSEDVGGSLLTIGLSNVSLDDQARDVIAKMFTPRKGLEKEGETTLELVKKRTTTITREIEPNVPKLVCGLLMRPSIRRLLGMSGGTSAISLPDWIVYPILRLAYITKLGATCQALGIASTKLDHGCDELAGPAFAAAAGAEYADNMASYVLAQRFDSDLGGFSLANPANLAAVLRFRETSEGIGLRKAILDQLAVRQGSDFVTSINAGLRGVIPTRTLQAANDRLKGLMIAEGAIANLTPAVWNDTAFTNKATPLWRKKSADRLREYCAAHGIRLYDPCPCKSGEKLRFCCEEALSQ